MAVKDESLHRATESLILPTPRTYYRASIHTSHWQLRSVISSPEQGVVYYPSGSDIYALCTRTREREIVTRLPFSPRCLVAGNGWLCCGGEPGHYTAIPLNEWNADLHLSRNPDAAPDARLPLDLDPTQRPSTSRDIPSPLHRSRGYNNHLVADVKSVGKEINNCITLWFPSSCLSERAYDTPVAVVSNNDKTISIVNLEDPEAEVLDQLTYPDCVNRAVISPDGELLVAVLDDPFLYVHQRKPVPKASAKSSERTYEWSSACRLQLESQKQFDQTNLRGSFALSFSKSGKYLAVGTQYGIISIFDTETIVMENSEPLVIFTTSRPMQSNGAVRSMEFSPSPFDLLAWTEASGRAGVADVRDLCISRQLLMVDCQIDGVERINVSERSADPVIDPRLRSFRSFRAESPDDDSTPDYLGLDLERRQLRHLTQEVLDRHHSPLTPEEMDILQAHRVARRYRDAEAEESEPTTWSPWAAEQRSPRGNDTPSNGEGGSNAERERRTPALPAALRDFVNSDRSISSSFRSFINERNQGDRRSLTGSRRDQPPVPEPLEEDVGSRETQVLSPADSTNDIERLAITPPPQAPWTGFENHTPIRSPQLPTVAQSSRLAQRQDERRQIEERRQAFERRYSHRPRPRPWRGLDELGLGNFDENVILRGVLRTGPANTMGCCWSPDGRILYVGAEDGIYEYHVNIAGRKKFPSVVLR